MGLESGIRKKPIPDPGSRAQKGTRSRIRNIASNEIAVLWVGSNYSACHTYELNIVNYVYFPQ